MDDPVCVAALMMRHHSDDGATEIAGVDIAGVIGSRKSMCAQKSLSYTLSRPMCCSYFWQMRHKTKALL